MKLKFNSGYPAPNIPASWNVCPTDPMLVAIRSSDGKRIPQQMRWGLVPWWAEDIKVGFFSINARAETVDTAPAFRDAWKKGQRCLVVTDGFYEWRKPEKQPYAVAMADMNQMVMAGLWDEWTDKKTGERVKSCTIVTVRPMRTSVHSMIACRSLSPKRTGQSGWARSPRLRRSSKRCSSRSRMTR
jgi:putative SOS response-associated peptidase YedK